MVPTRPSTSTGFRAEIARFERYLLSENKSDATIRVYINSLRAFARYAEEQGMILDVEIITETDVREYIASLWDEEKAPNTVYARYAGLKALYKWLIDQGALTEKDNPMARIAWPRVPEKNPPVVPEDKLRVMFEILEKDSKRDFAGMRDLAIVRMLLGTGCRLSEVANIMLVRPNNPVTWLEGDIDFDTRTLHVIGKGRKPRSIALPPKVMAALDRYMRQRAKQRTAEDCPYLWLSKRGGRIQPRGIYQMIVALGDLVEFQLYPHLFRHTAAHLCKEAGMSDADIMSMFGWTSIAMVLRYGRAEQHSRALAAARRYNIGDKF